MSDSTQGSEDPEVTGDDSTIQESSSERAVEAFDALPSDSHVEIDYPPKREGRTTQQLLSPLMELGPSARVEIIVEYPNGPRYTYTEEQEVKAEEVDDYSTDDIIYMVEAAYTTMMNRLGG